MSATGEGSKGTIWITGLPCSGKTTQAVALAEVFHSHELAAKAFDGDQLRAPVSKGLGFSKEDRDIAVFNAGNLALEMAVQGRISIAALVSPDQSSRDKVRLLHEVNNVHFLEVYLATALTVYVERDSKGLYRRALERKLQAMTGINDPYEPPANPEVKLEGNLSAVESAEIVHHAYLKMES